MTRLTSPTLRETGDLFFNGKAKDMDTSQFNDPAVREAMRDLNKTFRRMNTKLEIASLRIMGKSPFSIHPEVEERMERGNE